MKLNIHPDYKLGTVTCSCGYSFKVYSTMGDQSIDICSECHPFYTGKQKLVDTAGRIEKFKKKYKKIVTLKDLKSHKQLSDMRVVQRGNRLSITKLEKKEWDFIINLTK